MKGSRRNSGNTSKKRKKISTTTQEKQTLSTNINIINTNHNDDTINQILILDNGGCTIKHITIPVTKNSIDIKHDYKSTMNCTATLPHQVTMLIGDEIETKIQNKSQCIIQYPLERGYITDLGTQLRIWNRLMNNSTNSNASTTNNNCAVLLLTQPFTPKVISTNIDYTLYKDLNVSKVSRRLGASVAASYYIKQQNTSNKICLVIDSGFSMTHVIPTYNGYAISKGIKRINIGGKVLTNVLKQYISYRQWNMMDDFHIVNEIKEKCCFVMKSEHEFRRVMNDKKACHEMMQQFVLPDFTNTFEGYILNNEMNEDNQKVTISTERYAIPELLFHPSDIGIQQMGLSQTIAQSISLVDMQYQPSLWSNILFIGGNAKFKGIKERLEIELRSLAPDYIEEVNVIVPDDPIGYTIHAAEELVKIDSEGFVKNFCLDRKDWEEETGKGEDDVWERFHYDSELFDEGMVLI